MANFFVSALRALAASKTGSGEKKTVIIEPTRFTWTVAPAPCAASTSPASSRCPRASSRSYCAWPELAERGDARRHGERVPGEGAGLVDRAGRGDAVHHVGAAAEGAHRQAAADDLAEGDEVGADPVELAGAARRQPEAGHHLVDDEQRAVLAAGVEEPLRGSPGFGTSTPMLPTTGSTMTAAMAAPRSASSFSTAGRSL